MKNAIFFFAAIVAVSSFAVDAADYAGLSDWENPYVTSSNRMPARAVFVPASSMEDAIDIAYLRKPKTASKWVMSLDGEWGFEWRPWPKGCEIPADVAAKPETRNPKPATIKVPGCWQLQGDYDPPIYTNARFPHVKNPPYIMQEPPTNYTAFVYRNPVGTYSRKFTVPKEWDGRRVVLHFGGVYSAFYVRINGVQVGYSEDSRLPAEFDLTPYLKENDVSDAAREQRAGSEVANLLEVEVYRWCDGSYLEDQDFWRMSGIYRSVWLVAEREDGLKDVVIEPTLSDDMKTGEVKVSVDGGMVFKTGLTGLTRLEVVNNPVNLVNPVKKGCSATLLVENPALWDCDNPNLYTLVVEDRGDWYAFPVGFRKIAITNSVLKINNRRILVKGVNRHEMSPTGGYTVTLDEMKKDIEVFKSLGINAVRTCHYPDDPDWYTLCDMNGIYVTCEANIESHGMGFHKESLARREDFRHAHVERDVRMVQTLRNHASIIVWSQGNEAGYGENFAAARKALLEIDSSRPVQYENRTYSKKDRLATTDINCPMYRTPEQCEEFVANDPEMPLISCEYAHAMGNSTGGFGDFWRLADFYDSFQGGYIWDFADQGLAVAVPHSPFPVPLKYGGDFGDVPNDGSGHCNGIVDPFRKPHPGAFEMAHVYGLFPNSYPDPETVKLSPLLADLKVEPCFARPRTDNDNGSKPKRCDGTAKIRRIPIDAQTLRLAVEFEVPTNVPYAQRVGVAISLPPSFTNLTWRGRGPHENYPDRKFAAKIGEWSKNIAEMPPYIRPQDYGHFCDTSELQLGDLSAKCVFTSTPNEGLKDTFGFAAWPWTLDEIAKARHNEELPPSSGVTLVVDAAIMGVGGDDSWSRIAAPRPPHQPPPGRYTLSVELKAR